MTTHPGAAGDGPDLREDVRGVGIELDDEGHEMVEQGPLLDTVFYVRHLAQEVQSETFGLFVEWKLDGINKINQQLIYNKLK